MLPLVLSIVLAQEPTFVATRYDMGERLKVLDVAWIQTPSKERRTAAVKEVAAAVTGFFSGQSSKACIALDKARAALEGRSPSAADAVTLRFQESVVEPGSVAKLKATWAYQPEDKATVRLAIAGTTVELAPGVTKEVEVKTSGLNPEGSRTSEFGILVPAMVGAQNRSVYLSVVRNYGARVAALKESSTPVVKPMLQLLEQGSQETDVPLIDYLFTAEALQEGRLKLEDLDHVPLASQGKSTFRIALPKTLKGKTGVEVTVVVGLHGAGGSENLFFEGYGRGLAVKEALSRGWVFISPRATSTAVQDAADWIVQTRRLKVKHLFVMGHSMGGGLAFRAGSVTPKPAGLALFAPAAGSAPKSSLDLPIFLSVGTEEMGALRGTAQSLSREFADRSNFEYAEFSPCEHLMIVADSLPRAYKFFDRFAK
ncbi:MAG TPA: alpha/beta hydrolase [Fimbriimonadaceae bacterium]|nr:alpha/beta hydrolase [Fimbriimonadaceae bacterium]